MLFGRLDIPDLCTSFLWGPGGVGEGHEGFLVQKFVILHLCRLL